ncbi:hypothetical protein Hanom_Chr07g00618571 [Helianthus anomalus]
MGSTDEVLPAPAIAPIPWVDSVHDRRYAVDGEIMAFVVIFIFLVFLLLLVLAPHLIMRRKSSGSSSSVKQYSNSGSQRNRNSEDIP